MKKRRLAAGSGLPLDSDGWDPKFSRDMAALVW